jgi:chemotaxis protein MotA
MAAVGFIFAMACIFGVYIAEGGSMAPIIHAAPAEFVTIFGSAVGAMIISQSMDTFKAAFAGFGKVIAGPKYKKEDYLGVIFVVFKIMKTLKAEGAVALEAHVEAPESSAIFAEHAPLLSDHGVLDLICNTVRLLVVSSGTLSPYAVEDIMDASIKLHHHNEMKPSQAPWVPFDL